MYTLNTTHLLKDHCVSRISRHCYLTFCILILMLLKLSMCTKNDFFLNPAPKCPKRTAYEKIRKEASFPPQNIEIWLAQKQLTPLKIPINFLKLGPQEDFLKLWILFFPFITLNFVGGSSFSQLGKTAKETLKLHPK